MKEITHEEVQALIEAGAIRNTRKGLINKQGYQVGYYRTKNKRYIEDRMADLAKSLTRK